MDTVIILVILILLSAFFSASETAFTSANRIRLKNLAEEGSKGAEVALKVMDRYDKCLTTILVGNNIVNIATSSLATILCVQLFADKGPVIATAATTVIVLIFGEITPKTIAKGNAEALCIGIGRVMWFLMLILTPVSAVFLLIQKGASKLFNKKEEVSVTEQELMHIIDEIEDQGVLEEQESALVRNALEFDETTAEEIMQPRVKVVGIELYDSPQKVLELFKAEQYTRLPVYEKSLDHIVGVISYRDFTQKAMEGKDFNLNDILLPIIYVPSLMRISEVLKKMQREKEHIAVVVDQYGGTAGILTLEDVLEELVGEIWDEHDEVSTPVKLISEKTYRVSGEVTKTDFNRYFEAAEIDCEIDGDFNTVGGWVLELFGRIPEVGEKVETDRFKITVESLNHRRIGDLRLQLKSLEEEQEQ
ncbi:MAG: hemolysin family protein [Firmicutes bacterium]|nr:hemolysin family protein [[Eubacterium] siraeum]MCM1488436.1 hemolysin family protein [Bacillota bacterium]